jgi:serine/threonine protein kinase
LSLGVYQLLEIVGRGGSGIVFRARERATGQLVAVKILDSGACRDETVLRRFEQECAAAARLNHPNIVRALAWGVEDGERYLVMEFVEGQTLGAVIDKTGPLRLATAVELARRVGEALSAAHEHGLIHRDVKPENILLTPEGQVKLGDLGLVKDLKGHPDLTQSGAWIGTIDFMAPEQFGDAKNAGAACDVYGLAATVYYMITGSRPFPGQGDLAILKKKMRNDWVPAGKLVPGLPPGVDAAIRAALDADPARRPATCLAFVAGLEEALAEQVSQAEAPPPAGKVVVGVEERSERRFPTRLEARCRRVHSSSQDWSAQIRDVSATGICLELGRRYEPGTVLSILVNQDDEPATYLARVQWVKQASTRRWSVGCAFSRRLTPAELSSLLEQKSPTVMMTGPGDAPPDLDDEG